MLLKGKSISEQEFQRLLDQHQSDMKGLEGNFDKEKDRQKKSLADKVCINLYNTITMTFLKHNNLQIILFNIRSQPGVKPRREP